MSSSGEDHCLGVERVQFARGKFHGDYTSRFSVDNQEIQNLIFIEERHLVFQTLLIQGLQDHMTRAIRGMAGASHGFARLIISMTTERSLRDASYGRAVKGQPHV